MPDHLADTALQTNSPQANWDKTRWLSYLESVHPSEIELGLERVRTVAERLDCLTPAKQVIVLAGTNGKGTTSAMLSALLAKPSLNQAGKVQPPKSTALYNSPHIHDYNERISLNRFDQFRHIDDLELIASFNAVEQARGEIKLTYFEFGTLAALWQIKQWQVDVALLEIGLGGRLDAINIIDSDVAIVTSVGLDHMDWLGDSIEKIAYEKASIARLGKPLVCGQVDAPATVESTVAEIGGHLYQARTLADPTPVLTSHYSMVVHKSSPQVLVTYHDIKGQKRQLTLPKPQIPSQNMATAIQALALLDSLPSMEFIAEVAQELRVFGRMMRFQVTWQGKQLQLILDVAHNAQAAEYLASQVAPQSNALLAMLADKDAGALTQALNETVANWYLAPIEQSLRGQSGEQLAAQISVAKQQSFSSIEQALITAMSETRSDGQLLVLGSFFTLDAVLQLLPRLKGLSYEQL